MKRTRDVYLEFSDNYSLPPAVLPGSTDTLLITQECEVPVTHKSNADTTRSYTPGGFNSSQMPRNITQ